MSSLVSIILTSYNKPNFIRKAIDSVIQQSYSNWELFIMDDNSNKETVKIISSYLNDSRIHYINSQIQDKDRHKSTRYATLINIAIPKTIGKFISYLTDDNLYLPSRLEIMVKYLEEKNEVETVYSQQIVKKVTESGNLEEQMVRKTYGILRKPAGLVDHCSVMHTREIANKIYQRYGNYWDDNPKLWFNADASFWTRLCEYQPFYPIPQTLDVAFKPPNSFQRLYQFLPQIIPNGTLVKSPSSEIYLIDNQERRKITNNEVFIRLKYRKAQIVNIPDPFLFKYNEGDIIDNRVFEDAKYFPNQKLIMCSKHQNSYYIQERKKHSVSNRAIREFNFDVNNIIFLEENLINDFPNGPPILCLSIESEILPDGTIFRKDDNYYISFHSCLHLIDKNIAIKLNLNLNKPIDVNSKFITKYGKGYPFAWI